ncbi:hypothetical protein Pcinc_019212 [Petrolisthes cinctipes]|uniref:Uncharacterized protein n=1 Tax=Petrolisthes cinctipes TaxID=88211 RepID=A0AAE1FLM6_PETCI|nr:hypothetical protein Pcinc_019212 [Petrolisthes cinctipes]
MRDLGKRGRKLGCLGQGEEYGGRREAYLTCLITLPPYLTCLITLPPYLTRLITLPSSPYEKRSLHQDREYLHQPTWMGEREVTAENGGHNGGGKGGREEGTWRDQ